MAESSSGTSSGTTSTNATIDTYIEHARKTRSMRVSSQSKKRKTEEDEKQILIPIGEMYHCERRGKGIHKRGGKLKNVCLMMDFSYQQMLDKCVSEIYPEADQEKFEFYLADSRGAEVWNGDKGESSDESPWTLQKYIKLSRIKYPSKARFFCVKKTKASEIVETETVLEEEQDLREEQNMGTGDGGDLVDRPFELVFIVRKKSLYREAWSFLTTSSQYRALYDVGTEFERLCYDNEGGDSVGVLPYNPLHLDDIFLLGIHKKGEEICLDVEYETLNGIVKYNPAPPGMPVRVWSGGYSCLGEKTAVLVSLVVSGHKASYQWYKGSTCISAETFPVLYPTSRGEYKCRVVVGQEVQDQAFSICESGMNWIVTAPEIVTDNKRESSVATPSAMVDPSATSTDQQPPLENVSRKPLMADNPSGAEADPSSVSSAVESSEALDIVTQRLKDLSLITLEAPCRLTLIKRIGQGTFGTVYIASWRGCLVAAKVLLAEKRELESVKSEINILRKVQHPNLSSFLGIVDTLDSAIALLSPLVNGLNLHDHIFGKSKKFSFMEKMYILIQTCQAITYLHTSDPPLAHLDVKPANILVDSMTLQTTLTDFGLSRAISSTTIIGTKTMMSGSPGFQAPEQLRAESLGPHCDVYAFGCVIIVVHREEALWPGLSPYQILCKVSVSKVYPSMEGLCPRVKNICSSALKPMDERPLIQSVLKSLLEIVKTV